MKRKSHSKTKIQATKPEPIEQFFSADRPDENMGVKKAKLNPDTGEMIIADSKKKRFLKHLTSKKRRQKERHTLKKEKAVLEQTI
jgi:hypothetical protein